MLVIYRGLKNKIFPDSSGFSRLVNIRHLEREVKSLRSKLERAQSQLQQTQPE